MTRRKEPRGLRPDEEALWRQVAHTAKPLHPHRQAKTPAPAPKTPGAAAKRPADPAPDLSGFNIGAHATPRSSHDLSPALSDRLAAQPLAMDKKTFARMKRGKLGIEGRLDLHGMTLADAQGRLNRFILDAHAAGKRLVLVITGKGRDRDEGGPIPTRRGALKHQVPQWLTSGALRAAVLQVTEAHRSHGGSGAYYVYLRRPR
ncbi:DNA mismatch repair protein MutS [Rhodobacteraceae bacterium CCMM004]|nr:DNA mismatch repair protein MutS [Rhodobacteraceae bacterium CCMM004]